MIFRTSIFPIADACASLSAEIYIAWLHLIEAADCKRRSQTVIVKR